MDSKDKALDRKETSQLIDGLKGDILRDWEQLSRRDVAAAKVQSRLALRDSLPEFLDQLVLTLACDIPKTHAVANAEVAREHGEDRANQPDYTLEEVIFEYQILREVIIESVDRCGGAKPEPLKLIHKYIDNGIGNAAATYAEIETERESVQARNFENAKFEAERSNQAKSAFLANMSHEIRTPLGAIMGFVDLLKDNGLTPEELQNYHSIIDRNSNHLLRIIDDILDLAKVEAGKIVIEKIEFSLPEFLAEFSALAGIKAKEKAISMEFIPETLVPDRVVSDPTRLRQILSNVVGNALKFTEKGGVEVRFRYYQQQLHFLVKDTGRGISPEQRSSLFRAFSQADSSTTRKFGGTGLGLVLTKKITQAFGGDFILRESEIGKGSTFEARVPVVVPPEAKLVAFDKIEMRSNLNKYVSLPPVDFSGLEVLLAEDSPDNQYLVQKILSKTGAKIVTANDGAEAVKLALAHWYDVILMDIQMPVMDGHEAVQMLRANGYTRPIIALTAHAMKEELEHAVQSGFSHFLTKPIDRKRLFEILEMLCRPHNLGL